MEAGHFFCKVFVRLWEGKCDNIKQETDISILDTAYRERESGMDHYIIETEGLTKYYGETAAVKGIGLHVKKGEIYALLL